jgi:hypothetical protein
MDIIKTAEKLMLMDEITWAKHANPYSVYTRFTTLPLLSLAIWSRLWFDAYAIIFLLLALLWIWLNPRLFSVPSKTNNWASMATFGERIYLNRQHENIPSHHLRFCRLLQGLSMLGIPLYIYGLYQFDITLTIFANCWLMVFKAWFVDRMVWLYQDMKDSNSEYQAWLKQ